MGVVTFALLACGCVLLYVCLRVRACAVLRLRLSGVAIFAISFVCIILSEGPRRRHERRGGEGV